MANNYLNILLVTLLGLFSSCDSLTLKPSDFISYCNNDKNGLIQKRTFNSINYSLKYEPSEYKAINELIDENKQLTSYNFEKIKKEYDGLYYFVFKMENIGSEISPIKSMAKNKEALAKLTQYCQSRLSNDFYLESDNGIISPVLFHLEDDYHLTNFNLISIAFEAKNVDLNNDFVFVYNDPFFSNGLIKFNITKESIKKLPKINI